MEKVHLILFSYSTVIREVLSSQTVILYLRRIGLFDEINLLQKVILNLFNLTSKPFLPVKIEKKTSFQKTFSLHSADFHIFSSLSLMHFFLTKL
jgi:hypothetical protein